MAFFGLLPESGDDEPLNEFQVVKVMASLTDSTDRAVFAIGFNVGLSVDEILSLKWNDVDYVAQVIKVWDTKKKRYRDAIVPKSLLVFLKEYADSPGRGRRPAEPGQAGSIFPTTRYLLMQRINRVTTKNFGREKTWHSIRKSYVLIAKDKGVPMDIVSENTGVSANALLPYWKTPTEKARNVINNGGMVVGP